GITPMHVTRGIHGDVRRERQRRKRRPPRESAIVGSVGNAARGIAEEAPWPAWNSGQFAPRPVTRGKTPAMLVVTREFAWVALGILALNKCSAPAILEIVTAFFAHEAVPNSTKIDP